MAKSKNHTANNQSKYFMDYNIHKISFHSIACRLSTEKTKINFLEQIL